MTTTTTASVISATTRSASSTAKRDRFLAAADAFLAQAHEELEAGDEALALEQAYLAALRTAGAVCATAPEIRRRKRLPSSAWDKLALTGPGGKRWAATFRGYSALRGRVASGIQQRPEMDKVTALLDEAEQFYLASLPEFGAEPPLVA
ncbi:MULTISPECIES: SAV_6107 family HEPN domain-containing protein [Corynebacterium]|uniref:SAV-6107-like HEPN domain-containing protein n=1 Tax=Corynebacterium hadale TaxID=2026255 RepID=A0A269PBQ7_9CORY|nr:SAV_6107 family HEPN domain-containing protein [Corynebacterium hadale]PAJ69132.1 hypothetical protein CIG21_08515 [Corynebacterium hadale]WKC60514.1 hypothetical protein CHAD_08245 [Corynebacterium hadale]